MKITDELLLAYIDGELSRQERAEVEAAVAADPELAERLRRHRAVGAMINGAFAGNGDEPALEPLERLLKPAAPVVSLDAARAKRAEPKPKPKSARPAPAGGPPINPRWAAMIAVLAIGVGLGLFIPRPETGPVNPRMEAVGVLAAALDSRLAATQSADATIRIDQSFKDRRGLWCRSFSGQGQAGIACRQGDRWKLRLLDTAAGPTLSPAIATAVAGMIQGSPADAATEKAAKAKGWR